MVATSPDYARRLIPKGCKYVRIPPCPRLLDFRTAEDRRQALAGHGAPAGLAPRRELYLALERTFVPDVIVVDGLPRGWYGELAELLERSQALKVNVLRPVLGAGAMQVAVADLGLEALGRLYDAFLIAGDRRTTVCDQELGFTQRETSKCRYLGYVSLPVSRAGIAGTRRRRGVEPGDRWVVCSAGSGFYAREMTERCLALTRDFPRAHFDIVSGPKGLVPSQARQASLRADGRVRVAAARSDVRALHAAADVVICHGGYNTLTEAMEGGATLVVDTREDRTGERTRHVEQLRPHYAIASARDSAGIDGLLGDALSGAHPRRSVRDTAALDFDGCREFARLVSDLRQGLDLAPREGAGASDRSPERASLLPLG
jgi:predicted glycosyltransferase